MNWKVTIKPTISPHWQRVREVLIMIKECKRQEIVCISISQRKKWMFIKKSKRWKRHAWWKYIGLEFLPIFKKYIHVDSSTDETRSKIAYKKGLVVRNMFENCSMWSHLDVQTLRKKHKSFEAWIFDRIIRRQSVKNWKDEVLKKDVLKKIWERRVFLKYSGKRKINGSAEFWVGTGGRKW